MWKLKQYRDKWYAVRRKDGNPQRVSLRTADREEADRRFRDFLKSSEEVVETVAEILESWRQDRVYLKSQATMKYSIKALLPHFGHLRPRQVTREACRDYTASATRCGKKSGTIRRELDVLRAALYWHDKHTPAKIEKPPAPPPKDRYLTREEYDKLLSQATAPHLYLFMELALATAARTSALLELTWDRVNFERGLIILSNGEETNKRRATVPMNGRARRALETAYHARTCDYVIEYGGEPVGRIIQGFKRTARRAGFDDVTPHVLRHTAAVWMAEAGVPISEISQFLGHTNSQMTERVYARYSPSYLHSAASALE